MQDILDLFQKKVDKPTHILINKNTNMVRFYYLDERGYYARWNNGRIWPGYTKTEIESFKEPWVFRKMPEMDVTLYE